jgi:hypothetical protein
MNDVMNRKHRVVRRRGVAVVYASIAVVALAGLLSLAVDYGRVQLARGQLRAAADAVARAGAAGLPSSDEAIAAANAVAALNSVDGSAITPGQTSVTAGYWADGAFGTSGSGPYNAVRVVLNRSGAEGVALPFARMFGAEHSSISAEAVAQKTTNSNWGYVGLDSIRWNGTAVWLDVWQYDSTDPGYTFGDVEIGSNGTITVDGTVKFHGSLKYGAGRGVLLGPSVEFNGTATANGSMLVFDPPAANGADATNNNATLPGTIVAGGGSMPSINKTGSGTVSLAGGTYWLNNVSVTGGTLRFNGAATLCVNGTFNVSNAKIMTYQNKPANLYIKMMSSGTISMTNPSADFYADVYAPLSPYVFNGMTDFFGRGVFKSIDDTGAGCMLHDRSLTPISAGASIRLVR